jgi:flagellar hook-length control protein FliK
MTAAVTMPPIETPDPLVPAGSAPSQPAAGDFDLLVALWQAAFLPAAPGAPPVPATPEAATVPDPSVTPDDSATAKTAATLLGPSLTLPVAPIDLIVTRDAVLEPVGDDESRSRDEEDDLGAAVPPTALPVDPSPMLASMTLGREPAPRRSLEGPEPEAVANRRGVASAEIGVPAASPRLHLVSRNPALELSPDASVTEDPVVTVASTPRLPAAPPAGPEMPRERVPAAAIEATGVVASGATRDSGAARPQEGAGMRAVVAARPESPVLDQRHPPLAAPEDARPWPVSGEGVEEPAAAEAAVQPTGLPSRRGPIAAERRDELVEPLAPASRDRDAETPRDVSEAGPGGPAAAAPTTSAERTSSEAVERRRPEAPRDVVDQVATRLRDVKSPGRHEISIRLDPPELGSLRIDARLEGSRVHVHIRAENAVTGDRLADALPRLRDALSQQGFTPGDVSVHLGLDLSGRHLARDHAPTFWPSSDGQPSRPPRVVPVAATARAVAVTDGLDVWA